MNGAHRARGGGWAMHEEGVELDYAFFIGQTAQADAVIIGIGLRSGDSRDGSIECVRARAQPLVAGVNVVQSVAGADDDVLAAGEREQGVVSGHGPPEKIAGAGGNACGKGGEEKLSSSPMIHAYTSEEANRVWRPPENNPGWRSVQAPGLGAKREIRSSKSAPRPGVSGLAQTARSLWRVSTSRQSSVCLFIFA